MVQFEYASARVKNRICLNKNEIAEANKFININVSVQWNYFNGKFKQWRITLWASGAYARSSQQQRAPIHNKLTFLKFISVAKNWKLILNSISAILALNCRFSGIFTSIWRWMQHTTIYFISWSLVTAMNQYVVCGCQEYPSQITCDLWWIHAFDGRQSRKHNYQRSQIT